MEIKSVSFKGKVFDFLTIVPLDITLDVHKLDANFRGLFSMI